MCDMTGCESASTHYVIVEATQKPPTNPARRRLELCRPHLDMAQGLHDAKLTKVIEYGRLDKAWAVHPGGIK